MTWTTFTTELDPDKPARSVDIKAIKDNITAQANGDSGAPKQTTAGVADKAITSAKLSDGVNQEIDNARIFAQTYALIFGG